jgi:hypothetical protein
MTENATRHPPATSTLRPIPTTQRHSAAQEFTELSVAKDTAPIPLNRGLRSHKISDMITIPRPMAGQLDLTWSF